MTTRQAPAATSVAGTTATRTLRAMASSITLRVEQPGPHAKACLIRAEAVFREVERTCSRFDPASALSLANAEPARWHVVPAAYAIAVKEAERAHRETAGLFDPRILDTLLAWGYDRSLPFAAGGVVRDGAQVRPAHVSTDPGAVAALDDLRPNGAVAPWQPQVVETDGVWRVNLDGQPIDLGGIGKGLAVRWAAEELAGAGAGYLVDAGGDGAFGGTGPNGCGWRIGVEDPFDGAEHVLVLELTDTGCATSSTRLRRWLAGGERVHHLVDPRTRLPGGAGLTAVTVVAPDAAWSEIWSKTLFLAGADGIRDRAESLGLAAAWVTEDGSVGTSTAMDLLVIWRSAHV